MLLSAALAANTCIMPVKRANMPEAGIPRGSWKHRAARCRPPSMRVLSPRQRCYHQKHSMPATALVCSLSSSPQHAGLTMCKRLIANVRLSAGCSAAACTGRYSFELAIGVTRVSKKNGCGGRGGRSLWGLVRQVSNRCGDVCTSVL